MRDRKSTRLKSDYEFARKGRHGVQGVNQLTGSGAPQKIEAVFEVLAVGFGGWVMVILALGLAGLTGYDNLQRPVWIAVILIIEALLTLGIISLLDQPTDPSQPSVFSFFRWSSALLPVSLAVVPLLLLTVSFTGWIFEVSFPQYASEGNPLLEKIRTPWDLVAFMTAGIVAGGIKEEVQRAFILLRFERHLGGIYPGLIIWSLVFGLGHYEQGWSSAFSAAILGLIFGGIFIWKKNLSAAVTVHAAYDVAVLLVYWYYLKS